MNRWPGRAIAAAGLLLCAAGSVCPQSSAQSVYAADGKKKVLAGDYRGAISALQSAASANSSDGAVYYWLGRAYYESKDYENAILSGEKSVMLDPKNSEYHEWLGRAYGDKADRERSFSAAKRVKAEFEAAVKLDGSNVDARRDLEQYCLDAPWIAGGNKDEAQAQVDAIAAVDATEGHVARAIFEHSQKRTADAEAEFRLVTQSKASRLEPYLEAADFFANENKPDGITAAMNAASAVASNDARFGYYRGVAAVLSGGPVADAERDLKSYIASTPDRNEWPSHAAAREWLGRLYEAQGNTAAAAEQYRAALQLEPNRKQARERLNKLEKSSP